MLSRKKVINAVSEKLHTLDLNNENPKINDHDLLELVGILNDNPNITYLDLRNNQIGSEGAGLLSQNKTLRTLYLYSGNNLVIEDLESFLRNYTLTKFPINGGSGNLLCKIREHIKSNMNNRRLIRERSAKCIIDRLGIFV